MPRESIIIQQPSVIKKSCSLGLFFGFKDEKGQNSQSFKRWGKMLFLLFLIGIVGALIFRIWQVKRVKSIPFSPQQSSFILKPPTDALKGKLVLAKGRVEKESREKDEFEKVSVEEEILQGERLATGERSQARVEFQDFVRINLTSNSEIDFISLLPSNFLISQTSGKVNYELLQANKSLSVRSLHVLLTFSSGKSQFVTEEGRIIVKIFSGRAKLAMVDLENKTHVWQLKKGQEILIDGTERSVEIKKL